MTLAKVEQLNLGLSASAVAVSYAVATPHFAISLAAGALLEALNLPGNIGQFVLDIVVNRSISYKIGAHFRLRTVF